MGVYVIKIYIYIKYMDEYIEWNIENGVNLDNVYMEDRTVYSNTDIPKDRDVVKVPENILLDASDHHELTMYMLSQIKY